MKILEVLGFRRKHVVEPTGRRRGAPIRHGLRYGMWVRYGSRTGILNSVNDEEIAEVVLVHDKTGVNDVTVMVRVENLIQATFEQIPEDRRPERDLATALGYV